MSLQATIESKLTEALQPVHLEVINESHLHNVPPGSERHFKVFVVAGAFEGQGRVERQRTVNRALAEEMAHRIHALSLHALTPTEWQAQDKESLQSPACKGGNGK